MKSRAPIEFLYVQDDDADFLAHQVGGCLGFRPRLLEGHVPNPHSVADTVIKMSCEAPTLLFNGSGYLHNSTLAAIRHLSRERSMNGYSPLSYVHIDGHDDIAPINGNTETYKSFVLGIAALSEGTYILEEGLTGRRNGCYITPAGPEEWGEIFDELPQRDAYLSIDLDVLDFDALKTGEGVFHCFPQQAIGFNLERLLYHIDRVGERTRLRHSDVVGFSREGASESQIGQSVANVTKVAARLIQYLE